MNKYAEHKLKCLLQNSDFHVSVPELCKQYFHTFGHELPYRELGFFSVEDYLNSFPEISCVKSKSSRQWYVFCEPQSSVQYQPEHMGRLTVSCQRGIKHRTSPLHKNHVHLQKYEELDCIKTDLVNLLKNCDNGLTIPELSRLYEHGTGKKLMNLLNLGYNTLYDFIDTVDELIILTKSDIDRVFWTCVPHEAKSHNSDFGKNNEVLDVCEQNLSFLNDTRDSSSCFSGEPSNILSRSKKLSGTESRISDDVKDLFRKILKKHPEGVWASQFNQKYKEQTGCDFEMQSLGYYNFITFIEDFPSIFYSKEIACSDGDFLLFDAEIFVESEKVRKQVDPYDKLSPAQKMKVVTSNVEHLLSFNEDGIYLDEFFNLYKLNFGKVFNLDEFGCQSLKVFFDLLAQEIHLCTVSTEKRTKVYRALSKFRGDLGDCFKFPVPSDIVDGDAEFEPQWVPKGVSFKYPTYVYTSHINSPSDFFIQFDDGDVVGVLTELMDNLQKFYDSEDGDLYKIHNAHLKKGFICVGSYSEDRLWHRIEITEVSCTTVKARFVDYGTIGTVHKHDLRYMREKFYDLPSQAVSVQMANVEPRVGNSWIDDLKPARDLLVELTSEQCLKTSIFGYNLAERVLYLYLWCESESSTINEILVQRGLARFCNHALKDNITVNPSWSDLAYENCAETPREAVLETSDSAVTDLSTSLGHMLVDGATGCGVKAKSFPSKSVSSPENHVCNQQNNDLASAILQILKSTTQISQNETLLCLLINSLKQNQVDKNLNGDFSSQLALLTTLQNLFPHFNTNVLSPNTEGSCQNDLLHLLLRTLSQNIGFNAQCQLGGNDRVHENKPSNVGKDFSRCSLQNRVSSVTARSHAPNLSCYQGDVNLYHTDINKPTSPATSISSFVLDDDEYFIPPPRPCSGELHPKKQIHVDISSPVSSYSLCRDSNISCASAFSSISCSHSMNSSSMSSDEKQMVFGSPSSNSEQQLFYERVSPSSEKLSHSFRSSEEENELDIYDELFEYPIENLCKGIMSKSDWNVKRLFLENVTVHIIKLMDMPHISCHEVACITVGSGDVTLLSRKGRGKCINRTPVKIYKMNDEALFEEIERYGIEKISYRRVRNKVTPVLSVFPLRVAVDYILNLAANPKEIIENIQFQIVNSDIDDSQKDSSLHFQGR